MYRLFWQQIPNTIITEVLCKCCDSKDFSFDGVVLDTEHAPFSDETTYNCIQVANLLNKQCFVRVTDLNKKFVRMILDAGASGIIFSTIETFDQALEATKYCLYPSYGGIRGQGLVRENEWGRKKLGSNKPILVGQIETIKGVDNCHDFKDLFDYFLIGPYDLSASLGKVGDFKCKEYEDAIFKINSKIPKEKMGYHIVNNIEKQYINNNYKEYPFLAFSTDVLMIMSSGENISKIVMQK